jgi:D-3-phosphoglycerate dehydrogenase / 2-oxoglutarate reductase
LARVLVCDQVDIERLDLGPGLQVDFRPAIGRQDLLKVVQEYDALIIRSRTKVDREVLDRAARLRLVARPGTGLDNVDVEYAESKGVQLINSPGSLVEAVAEHVTLLMLALSRKLVAADESTKAGRWEKSSLMGAELKGKALGIVGLGRIGRRIGEIAKALGMALYAYDVVAIPPDVVENLGVRVVPLDELFRSSDFITLHVPLTDETRHMVDQSRLSQMKAGSFLVNTSRGGVVDEDSLANALNDGHLGGAALDVFENEPPSGTIMTAKNTILTPHIGGQTAEAQADAIAEIGAKVRKFFATP